MGLEAKLAGDTVPLVGNPAHASTLMDSMAKSTERLRAFPKFVGRYDIASVPSSSSRSHEAPGGLIATWWHRLSTKPGGRALFSIMIGRIAPYTSSIGARVEALE